ncbi:hypothetical protein J6590_051717 [Homalodisca vitripennis]|nr:hypothetical protein J6590_051717 [Homalodisca vitripennis]
MTQDTTRNFTPVPSDSESSLLFNLVCGTSAPCATVQVHILAGYYTRRLLQNREPQTVALSGLSCVRVSERAKICRENEKVVCAWGRPLGQVHCPAGSPHRALEESVKNEEAFDKM